MDQQKNDSRVVGPLANEEIRAEKVQVIDADGVNHGVVERRVALTMAKDAGLDLVLLADSGSFGVPVTKIMDIGKELYNRKKKQAEAKKHQKVILIKEIRIRPKIGEHDFQTKLTQGVRFLEDGNKLKVTLVFRGREAVNRNDQGRELFDKIGKTFEEHGVLERIIEEKELRADSAWSKVFFMKKK